MGRWPRRSVRPDAGLALETRRVSPGAPMVRLDRVEPLPYRGEGASHLHFGFTPFVFAGEEGPGASRVVAFILRLLGRWGGFIYPARSQIAYKLKWGPDLVEREYLAFRPLSFRAVWDLLLLTRSI